MSLRPTREDVTRAGLRHHPPSAQGPVLRAAQGGSRDTAWLPPNPERSQRRQPACGTRVAARPAPPRPVLGGWWGGPAGYRRADWLVAGEVAAADRGRYRRAAADGDHGKGRLSGLDLVGADARRGVPGDAVRRVPIGPGVGFRRVGYRIRGRRFGRRRLGYRRWLVGARVHIEAGRDGRPD